MDEQIDWQQIVGGLLRAGMTQPQIAQACECGQSTVSELHRRKTLDPRASLAFRMLKLARSRGIRCPAVVWDAPESAADRQPQAPQLEPQHAN